MGHQPRAAAGVRYPLSRPGVPAAHLSTAQTIAQAGAFGVPDALLLRRQGLASAGPASALLIELFQPALHRARHQVHVAAHLRHAKALLSNHANHLQLECRIEGSAGSLFCHAHVSSWGKIPIEVSIQIGP
jgi:hypothetical protein